jgi:hypothetical protein
LTRRTLVVHVPPVSTDTGGEPRKKHRHDLGHEDHGPVYATGTTRAIQSLLGLWILLTFAAVIWALIEGGRGETPTRPETAPVSTSR